MRQVKMVRVIDAETKIVETYGGKVQAIKKEAKISTNIINIHGLVYY